MNDGPHNAQSIESEEEGQIPDDMSAIVSRGPPKRKLFNLKGDLIDQQQSLYMSQSESRNSNLGEQGSLSNDCAIDGGTGGCKDLRKKKVDGNNAAARRGGVTGASDDNQ